MKNFNEKVQMFFAAAAFAEAGEFNTAREIMEYKKTIKLRDEKKLEMRTRPRLQQFAPSIKYIAAAIGTRIISGTLNQHLFRFNKNEIIGTTQKVDCVILTNYKKVGLEKTR